MQESSYELMNEHQVVEPQVDESENVTTDKAWKQYQFTLKAGAAIPRDVYHEAMVVKVVSGSVAFRIGHEDVTTLDPHGKPILTLDWDDDIEAWQPTGELNCDVLCGVRSDDPEKPMVVRLDAGATVYLPGSVTCFFCNTMNASEAGSAELMVLAAISAADKPFSWTQINPDEIDTVVGCR